MNTHNPTHEEQLVILRGVLERNGTDPADVDRLFQDVPPAGIGTILRWATEVDLLSATIRAEREKLERRRTVLFALVFLLLINLARSVTLALGWIPLGLSDLMSVLTLPALLLLGFHAWKNL